MRCWQWWELNQAMLRGIVGYVGIDVVEITERGCPILKFGHSLCHPRDRAQMKDSETKVGDPDA